MKIQLSIAISGREESSRREALAAQRSLEAKGHTVINPFELCEDLDSWQAVFPVPASEFWLMCMERCMKSIVYNRLDMLIVIGGRLSCGVNIEIETAERAGVMVAYLQGDKTRVQV